MKKFIGRKSSIAFLKKDFHSNNSYLNIVTGRRGVGKTSLLNHFVENVVNKKNDSVCFFITGSLSLPHKEMVLLFSNIIFSKAKISKNDQKEYLSFIKETGFQWKFVFEIFEEILIDKFKNEKISLIIDEFSWFHNKRNNFAEEFGNFWVRIKTKTNIHCVVCGSAVGLMLNLFYKKARGSLYHKADARIHLKPFSLLETFEYFKENHNNHLNKSLQLQYYLFTGGVVRYLDKIRPDYNLNENINLIFNEFLNSQQQEFNFLFSSTFGKSGKNFHKEIMLCFKKNNKLTFNNIFKILNKKGNFISKSSLYLVLNELEEVDFLKRIVNIKNKNEPVYMVYDLFCFYNLKFSNEINENVLINNDDLLQKYNGYAFEILAFLNIDLIKEQLSRNGFKTIEFKFQNDKAQIDLIIDYGKNQYSIVECKHYNNYLKLDENFYLDLENKKQEFSLFLEKNKKKKHHIDFVVFSIYGVDPNSKGNVLPNVFDVNLTEVLNI